MASYVKRGQFSKRSGTGTQAVTGVGFTPKALFLYSNGKDASGVSSGQISYVAWGLTVGPSDSYSVALTHATQIQSTRNSMVEAALHFVNPSGGVEVRCDLDSFDADGFTLDWTVNNTNVAPDNASIIDYIAIGGDIQAAIVPWNLPSGTGSRSVTGMGFEPELLFHLYGNNSNNGFPSTGAFGALGIGLVDADGTQIAEFTATSGTAYARTIRTDMSVIQVSTGALNRVNISHTSMDADGFTHNVTAVDATYVGAQYITLGLRGIDAKVGTYQRSTSTTNVISGLGFAPELLFQMSVLTTATGTNSTGFSGYALGFGDASSQAVKSHQYTNNTPLRYQATDAIHAMVASGVAANVTELVSLDATGYTVDWVSGSDAHFIGYLALAGISDAGSADIEAETILRPVSTLAIQQAHHLSAATLLSLVTALELDTEPTGTNIAAETILRPVAALSIQQDHLLSAEAVLRLVAALSLQTDNIALISATTILRPIATAQLATAHHVRPAAILRVLATLAIEQDHLIRARTVLRVLAYDNYVGPGTGIVVPGQRFTVNALREGDSFTVFIPYGGLEGVMGQAHVMSRTFRDDRADQEVELAIVENDNRNVPRMRGGATPRPTADGTDVAREQSRQSRKLDRLERNN